MKNYLYKRIALILTLAIFVSIIWNQNLVVVSAATTPSLVKTKVELVGEGETYQVEIKNKVAKSTYKWTTSNKAVAKVSSKGIITTVGAGTAKIKCKITYPSKKTKTLTTNLTVIIPATGITISNAVEVNGAHRMPIGSSMDFERILTPITSSDQTYWYVERGDCIRIDDNLEGKVTAVKAGKAILAAVAVKKANQKSADESIIDDHIIIEVIEPRAKVQSAEIIGSTEIKVVFESPINSSTVLGSNNTLSGNITIKLGKDVKGVLAADPGALTASLSSDLMTLTITSKNRFDGKYGIDFTNKVLTTAGVPLEPYYKELNYTDTAAPSIISTVLDDSGMITTINFSEAIDFTGFKVSNATLVSGSTTGTADPTTISTLNNRLNYVASADKKSLTINLSKIVVNDYGKVFTVIFSGIKDLSGNAPASFTLPVTLRTDTTLKAQARPISIVRSSYNTLTATFSRAIKEPGFIQIDGGALTSGVVDKTNNKKVNYTITTYEAQYTGLKPITIGLYNSYNVNPSDTYANDMKAFGKVDFTADKITPILQTYDFDAETNLLKLTYNEEVRLQVPSNVFSTTLVTVTDDIKSGTNINYDQVTNSEENNKVITLKMTNMTTAGNYTFTLDKGFVVDNFNNESLSRVITISNASGSSAELAPPYLISQSTTDLSKIYLQFANKLDVPSAEKKTNYNIAGVTILSAKVENNTVDNGATVVLTVADGSIDVSVERPITISGVLGYNGSYTEMLSYTTNVELKDNKKPQLLSTVYDSSARDIVRLTFSEQIEGDLEVRVTQMGLGNPIELRNDVAISGNIASINLLDIPSSGTYLRIEVITNSITDMSGNASAPITTTGVTATYR